MLFTRQRSLTPRFTVCIRHLNSSRGHNTCFLQNKNKPRKSICLCSVYLPSSSPVGTKTCTRVSITRIIRQQNDLLGGLYPVYRIREPGVKTTAAVNTPKHGGLAAYISIITISHGLEVTDYCMAYLMQEPRTPHR